MDLAQKFLIANVFVLVIAALVWETSDINPRAGVAASIVGLITFIGSIISVIVLIFLADFTTESSKCPPTQVESNVETQ
jgi:p-aminobenzoyl-glutamate transporter AbgT